VFSGIRTTYRAKAPVLVEKPDKLVNTGLDSQGQFVDLMEDFHKTREGENCFSIILRIVSGDT
jgi:hypothetical protein